MCNRFYGSTHIAHVLYGLCHFLTGTFGFLRLVDNRRVSHSSQGTIYPARGIPARPVVNIQLCLYQAEPFGIRILADIHREA